MCSTCWQATLLRLDEETGEIDRYEPYGDDELLTKLGLAEREWSVGATIPSPTRRYHTDADGRRLAVEHAARMLAYYPELAGRVAARRIYWCSGSEIDEIVDDAEIAARAAEILAAATAQLDHDTGAAPTKP